MRKKWSLLFLAAIATLAVGSPAALAQGKPQTAAYPTCVVKKIAINQSGQVTVQGGCTLRGKPIPSVPSYTYFSTDIEKYSCGVTTGLAARGKFVLGPVGIAAASGSIRYLPKTKYARVASKAKPFQVTLTGSDNLQCGKPINLPPPSVLCDRSQWPPFGWPGYMVVNCGQEAQGGVSFSSPMTLVNGVLTVGHVVSPSGSCSYEVWKHYFNVPENKSGQLLLCKGADIGAIVELIEGRVTNSKGEFCPSSIDPTFRGQRSFTIPVNWSGTIYVSARIVSYPHWSKVYNYGLAKTMLVTQTAKFTLQGSQEPCVYG